MLQDELKMIDFVVEMIEWESETIDFMMKMIDREFEMIDSALRAMTAKPGIHKSVGHLPFTEIVGHILSVVPLGSADVSLAMLIFGLWTPNVCAASQTFELYQTLLRCVRESLTAYEGFHEVRQRHHRADPQNSNSLQNGFASTDTGEPACQSSIPVAEWPTDSRLPRLPASSGMLAVSVILRESPKA